jgi:hypothetical protein
MNERILDLRFAICDLATGRGNQGGSHDGGQFASFLVERMNLPFHIGHNAPLFGNRSKTVLWHRKRQIENRKPKTENL